MTRRSSIRSTGRVNRGAPRLRCQVPKDVREAYQSTWGFTEWEMSTGRKSKKRNYEMIEALLDTHERELRSRQYLVDGERVIHYWRNIALVTRCWRGRTRTLLCVRSEIEDA